MKTIDIKGHKVEIYDSIDELPIRRFHKFNRYMLVDAGIGSDLNDINEKIKRIQAYIEKQDKKNAYIELDNLRQSLYITSQEINPKHLAFMTLIKSVDGKEQTDLSDEGIKKMQALFEDKPVGFLNRLLDSVKKKIDTELNLYFPEQFNDAAIKEYYDKLRKRTLFHLDKIIRNNDHSQEVSVIDDFLLTLAKPRIFSGKESAEIRYDRQFEDMCLFLSHEISLNIDGLNTLQFYNSFEYIKKQHKKNGR